MVLVCSTKLLLSVSQNLLNVCLLWFAFVSKILEVYIFYLKKKQPASSVLL